MTARDHYKKLTFNHANLNRPVNILAGTISAWHYSKPTECNIIYTTAGVFPVKETDEEILAKFESITQSAIGQENKDESK